MVIVPSAKFFRCVLEFLDKQGFRVRLNSLRRRYYEGNENVKVYPFSRFSFQENSLQHCKSADFKSGWHLLGKVPIKGFELNLFYYGKFESGNIKVVIRKTEFPQNAFANSTFRYANSPFRYTNYYTRAVCSVLSTGYFQNRLLTVLFLSTIPKCIFKI